MVQRVQTQFKTDGPAATFEAVRRDPGFSDRDLYPFIYRLTAVNVGRGARPALVGKNLINSKNQDGIPLIQKMVEIAKNLGSRWVDYKWSNPLGNAIEDKSSYIDRMGNYFVGVGLYRR